MDFKDIIKQLSERIHQLKDNIATEEATKNAFIMPFINALGYDVFNPMEVVPEMDCDLIKKKGEKIDYAIMKDGHPIMLIECKHWKQNLSLHDNQLQKYFVASKAKFGVLTNGIKYLFYTDLANKNIMDEKPFLDFDITDIKEYQLEELKKFHKSYFDIDNILNSASELKYLNELKIIYANEFNSPSTDFVKFFAKQVYDGVVTSKIQEQFTELIKKSLNSYIADLISNKLKSALNSEVNIENEPNVKSENTKEAENDTKVITTDEEIEAFNIIKALVRRVVDLDRIICRDAQRYCAILLDDNNRKPICRLYFNGISKKYVSVFDSERQEIKHEINTLNDIFDFANDFCNVIKMYDEK